MPGFTGGSCGAGRFMLIFSINRRPRWGQIKSNRLTLAYYWAVRSILFIETDIRLIDSSAGATCKFIQASIKKIVVYTR